MNNANQIATRLVYDTLRVELVWANRIEGAPMPRHQMNNIDDDDDDDDDDDGRFILTVWWYYYNTTSL